MNLKVFPSQLKGDIIIPPSKSLTHRALICASLSLTESIIHNPLYCDDTIATIDCLRKLGVVIVEGENSLSVVGVKKYQLNGKLVVGDSASTLRFLLPLISLHHNHFSMYGSKRLMERIRTQDLKDLLGLDIIVHEDHIEVKGRLSPGAFHPNDQITSQIISGLCFALPFFDGRMYLENTTNPYVMMTLEMIRKFGVVLDYKDKYFFHLEGTYQGCHTTIESDFSSAAIFIAMMLFNRGITIHQLDFTSFQGDIAFIEYLKKMGAEFITADYKLRYIGGDLEGTTFDLQLTPDVMPVLCAVASVTKGTTVITGIEKLKFKESNRSLAICESLRTLGADITLTDNSITIVGKEKLKGGCDVFGHDDHRIVMSLVSIASCVDLPYTIMGADSVSKSFPTFWDLFAQLGGKYER